MAEHYYILVLFEQAQFTPNNLFLAQGEYNRASNIHDEESLFSICKFCFLPCLYSSELKHTCTPNMAEGHGGERLQLILLS